MLGVSLAGLTTPTNPSHGQTKSGSVTWENLGVRSDDPSSRAWFCVPRRQADGRAYLFSGTTNGKNHLLRFNPTREYWEMVKRGSESFPYFPFPGAQSPGGTDNGHAVWDNVNDELWVSVINARPVPPDRRAINAAPAIYNPATDKWRQVTQNEFPSYDFTNLPELYNAGAASSPTHIVVYGGSGATLNRTTLWVYSGKTRKWQTLSHHGEGAGKPGPLVNIQSQFHWHPDLGLFILYANQMIFTLTPGEWSWQVRRTDGEPPTISRSIGAIPLIGKKKLAVFGGETTDVWLLDCERWSWSRLRGNSISSVYLPRLDAAFHAEGTTLYMAWGYLPNNPDSGWENARHLFRCRLPASAV
jgi:hypothetical protein